MTCRLSPEYSAANVSNCDCVSSLEPSLTTMTSKSLKLCCVSDRRQCIILPLRSRVGITTEISGATELAFIARPSTRFQRNGYERRVTIASIPRKNISYSSDNSKRHANSSGKRTNGPEQHEQNGSNARAWKNTKCQWCLSNHQNDKA